MKQFKAVILAAGKGTRMKSELPKVMHKAVGCTLLEHALRSLVDAGATEVVAVFGHGREEILPIWKEWQKKYPTILMKDAWQKEQKGTGHALICAFDALGTGNEPVLVVNGDGPLLQAETLKNFFQEHDSQKGLALTLAAMKLENPFGYGRLILQGKNLKKIIEEKEASTKEKKVQLVNGGIYIFDRKFLNTALLQLKPSVKTGEIYITDLVGIGTKLKKKMKLVEWSCEELKGVNDMIQLDDVEKVLCTRKLQDWMKRGIRVIKPESIYVESSVECADGALIEPNVILKGDTKIGLNAIIEAGVYLDHAVIGDGAHVKAYSHLEKAIVGKNAQIGPFARLRPEANVGADAKIGNFVELKKTKIGTGSKVSHLSYLGDAVVGDDVNIGCGFITCNYDGFNKHITNIADGAFVGSDVQAVAPLSIGKDSYVASGTTLTRNVPDGALAIARAKQENKDGYAVRIKNQLKSKTKKGA